jgi:2-methylcitrate dehydratase PrpD
MTPEDHLITLAHCKVTEGPLDLMALCLFDWVVCATGGVHEPVADVLRGQSSGTGPSLIIGGAATAPAQAALVNGAIGHALDYDDTHFGHIGHTSSAVMPAVLALGEAKGSSIVEMLGAALVGSEAAVRAGLWLGRDHYQIGFHQTATSGAFGATVAAARLLGLDAIQTGHAIGLAATSASGLKGQFGTMGKPLNAGLAARCGVEAGLWARAGMTADIAGLSGPLGFGATHHGMADDIAWATADTWHIVDMSHKFHACCHGLHAMIEALGPLDLDVSAIACVQVTTHPRWMSVCNQPAPDTGLGLKFSYAMTAAMALSGVDTARIANFNDQTAQDPALVILRDKVQVVADPTLSEMQAKVMIALRDGRIIHVAHDLDTPLSLAERETRLRAKAEAVVGASTASRLWQAVSGEDATSLWKVLQSCH